jgi:hypothetical protein
MLSKSILGQQCHKSLWLDAKNYEKTNPMDAVEVSKYSSMRNV